MFCPACGQETSELAQFCQYCGQPLQGTAPDQAIPITPFPPRAVVHYAGFWRRFWAVIIDSILIYIVIVGAKAALGYPLGAKVGFYGDLHGGTYPLAASGGGFFIGAVIQWLYWAIMESSEKQATIGKMAFGIIVTDLQGAPISFGQATGRYFGKIVSALIFGIGFMMAGWTAKKQALHDMLAGTLVIKKRFPDEPS